MPLPPSQIEVYLNMPSMTFSLALRYFMRRASADTINLAEAAATTPNKIADMLTTIPSGLNGVTLTAMANALGVPSAARPRLLELFNTQEAAPQDNTTAGRIARLERIARETALAN